MKLRTKLWRMLPFCWTYTDCRWIGYLPRQDFIVHYVVFPWSKNITDIFEYKLESK